MLDWLIIGGGVIGTTLSNYIVNAHGTPADRVRVLDPHPSPLAQWTRLTGNTGMRFLRSPQVHHIDVDHFSLQHYIDDHPELGGSIRPYRRPAYPLFQAHCTQVIQQRGLDALRLQGSAEFILSTKGGLTVETSNGTVKARRVVLAIGRTKINNPTWAQHLQAAGAPVQHIFESDFDLHTPLGSAPTVVVGGGITAGQVALHLCATQPGSVTLLMRHPITEADFDSSPCWLGPKCSGMFKRTRKFTERRALLTEARNRGSMSSDIAKQTRQALQDGTLHRTEGEIASASYADGQMTLQLQDGRSLTAGRVLLATGFDMARPGGAWLDEVIEWFDLPLARCGYPIVDSRLCWGHNIHVSGALAELELGPPAGNIIGGKLAAQRLRGVAGAF